MDVLKIERDTSYLPIEIIDNFSSFIWTERFQKFGDSQIVSTDVQNIRNTLPIGSMYTHSQTKSVMMVVRHDLGVDPDTGDDNVTINAKTLDYIMSVRTARGWGRRNSRQWDLGLSPSGYSRLNWLTYQIAAALMHMVLADTEQAASSSDKLPNVRISVNDHIYLPGLAYVRPYVGNTTLWEEVDKKLRRNGLGINILRPPTSDARLVVWNYESDTAYQRPDYVDVAKTSKLLFNIYQPVDRSNFDEDNVTFDEESGHVSDPRYYVSVEGLIKRVLVYSKDELTSAQTVSPGSGWDLSVEPLVEQPPDDMADDIIAQYEYLREKGKEKLDGRNRRFFFQGQISPNNPYVYGTDYYLGDRVRLQTRYKDKLEMVVEEHTTVIDSEGIRQYPTLVHHEEISE